MNAIEKLIRELETSHFWGELSLKFQDGQIVHAKKIESLDIPKPQNTSRTERRQYEQSTNR
jgi:hypothetical protein